mmetsp:Transcript_27324/g.69234  ORF Transcript_27324/g.69234 Transcript_27324/m.69234 type:complete len:346 (+) Transcript_27324:537-1574(+)
MANLDIDLSAALCSDVAFRAAHLRQRHVAGEEDVQLLCACHLVQQRCRAALRVIYAQDEVADLHLHALVLRIPLLDQSILDDTNTQIGAALAHLKTEVLVHCRLVHDDVPCLAIRLVAGHLRVRRAVGAGAPTPMTLAAPFLLLLVPVLPILEAGLAVVGVGLWLLHRLLALGATLRNGRGAGGLLGTSACRNVTRHARRTRVGCIRDHHRHLGRLGLGPGGGRPGGGRCDRRRLRCRGLRERGRGRLRDCGRGAHERHARSPKIVSGRCRGQLGWLWRHHRWQRPWQRRDVPCTPNAGSRHSRCHGCSPGASGRWLASGHAEALLLAAPILLLVRPARLPTGQF